MYQDIEYDGIKGSNLKIYARERPSIPAARVRREQIIIPGRDGAVYESDGTFEPTEIEIQFNYIGEEREWGKRWRAAQRWLAKDNAKLRFSDDDGYFLWISNVSLEANERTTARIGNFSAVFTTKDGLYYLNSGLREHTPEEIKWNPYERSNPVFRVIGEGMCTLAVNGRKMTANVGQNLTIDTERMLAYREDGSLQNTAVSGNYENLRLEKGEIKIETTKGFDVKVIPNWRCI